MKSFQDFLNESDSEETPRRDDKGAAGGLGDLKRPGSSIRPTSAMSASTTTSDDGGMMIGGVKVRMPGQSRPNSATSAATLSRPTSAVSTSPWPPAPPSSFGRGEGQRETSRSPFPDEQPKKGMLGLGPTDSLPGRSKSPAPDEQPKKGMLGLGPTDSLRGRSKSPAPDEKPKQGMLGLGPTDSLPGRSKSPAPDEQPKHGMLGLGPTASLRGRSKSPAPDEQPKKGMLGLGPTDSLRGRSKSPAPDEQPKHGMLGLGPTDSLPGRSKSPAPDRLGPMESRSGPSSGRVPAPWEQPAPMGLRNDVPFPPGSAPAGGRLRPGSAARAREAPAPAPPKFSPPSAMHNPPSPAMMDLNDLRDERSMELDDVPKHKKDKKEKKEKKSKKEKKEQKEREEEERRLQQEREEQEKKAQKEKKKEEKRLQKQKEKEERQREENRKKEPVTLSFSDDTRATSMKTMGVSVEVPQAPSRPSSHSAQSSVSSSARPKQSHLKTGRPRIRRFLLTFDPLGLTVVWEKNGQRKATALHVDPEELDDVSSQRNFAKRLVKKWEFLQESHTTQIEILLQRLARRVLPVYRVESPKAIVAWEAPNCPGNPQDPLCLPPGLMFLVVERTRCVDGWWLRLASGKRWVPEILKDEVVCVTCTPSVSEATEALRSLRVKQKPSNVVERNARLVCSQLQKQQAPVESNSLS